ncbi:MAG TPA: PhnD/SsuA/transferrin family substrate-binding protein [Polyangiaceae bacterium]
MTVDRIVLGLVPTDRLRARDARTRKFVHALQDRLGVHVVERNVDTYDELEQAMTAGRIDLAWLPPLVFARLDQRSVARAVATVVRPGDAFWSVLVTSPASGITRLVPDQLRGRRIAWVDRLSASGHIVARLGLSALGLDPRATFASESFAGSHIEALHAVLEGRADVAATFARCASQGGIVHGPWTEAGIPASDVVVLGLLGEVPPDLIAASSRLPPEMRTAIEGAMMDVARDDALAPSLQAIFGGTKFAPGAPASYAALCQLLDRSSSTLEALASTNPPSTGLPPR